jgi:hypothetical protein
MVAILGVVAEIAGLRLRMYQNFEIRQTLTRERTQKFTRRDVLNSASGLVAATALGGLIDNGAVASEGLPGHAQDKLNSQPGIRANRPCASACSR